LIKEFHGVKKRLEFLYRSDRILVVDDFGIAPDRAKNSLETLHENFPEHKIIAVFEPNAGSRPGDLEVFNKIYNGAFDKAYKIIIPDLSDVNSELTSANEISARLTNLGFDSEQVSNAEINNKLKAIISEDKESKFIVVFFSSYKLTEIAAEFVRRVIGEIGN
jgi:UDP-N-acetylmuramate-alanine ligase